MLGVFRLVVQLPPQVWDILWIKPRRHGNSFGHLDVDMISNSSSKVTAAVLQIPYQQLLSTMTDCSHRRRSKEREAVASSEEAAGDQLRGVRWLQCHSSTPFFFKLVLAWRLTSCALVDTSGGLLRPVCCQSACLYPRLEKKWSKFWVVGEWGFPACTSDSLITFFHLSMSLIKIGALWYNHIRSRRSPIVPWCTCRGWIGIMVTLSPHHS